MEAFFIHLLKSVFVLGLFLTVYLLFLKRETLFTANRWYLLTGIATSLLLPFFYITEIVWIEPEPVLSTAQFIAIPAENSAQITTATPFKVNWWLVLGVIYAIGVLVMASRFLIQLFSLKKLLRDNYTFQKEGILYTEVNDHIAPFSFGNHIVYNPRKHSAKELELILKHEQEHVKQHHTIDLLVSNLLIVSQWCNPLAWIYKNNVEQNLEFLADAKTLENSPSKREYQLAMVRVSARNAFPEVTTNFYQSFIKKRIIMLNKDASKTQRLWKLGIIIPCLIAFIYMFNVKTIAQEKPVTLQQNYNPIEFTSETESTSEDAQSEAITTETISKTEVTSAENHSESNARSVSKTNSSAEKPTRLVSASAKSITVTVTSETTDAELDAIAQKFKMQGVTVKFKGVKRKDGRITAIKVDVKSDKTSGNYSVNDEDAIIPFKIAYDDEAGSIAFGSIKKKEKIMIVNSDNASMASGQNVWVTKDIDSIVSLGNGNNFSFISKNGDSISGMKKIIINRMSTDSTSNGHNFIFHSDDDDHDEIIINGKAISMDSMHMKSHKIFLHDGDDHEESIFQFDSDDGDIQIIKGKTKILSGSGKEKIFIKADDDTTNTSYFIDGKKVTKADIDKLDPKDVLSVDVTKNDDKAEIHIKTKKN